MTSKNRVKSNTANPNLGLLNNVVILHYDSSKILTINFSINLKMCQLDDAHVTVILAHGNSGSSAPAPGNQSA